MRGTTMAGLCAAVLLALSAAAGQEEGDDAALAALEREVGVAGEQTEDTAPPQGPLPLTPAEEALERRIEAAPSDAERNWMAGRPVAGTVDEEAEGDRTRIDRLDAVHSHWERRAMGSGSEPAAPEVLQEARPAQAAEADPVPEIVRKLSAKDPEAIELTAATGAEAIDLLGAKYGLSFRVAEAARAKLAEARLDLRLPAGTSVAERIDRVVRGGMGFAWDVVEEGIIRVSIDVADGAEEVRTYDVREILLLMNLPDFVAPEIDLVRRYDDPVYGVRVPSFDGGVDPEFHGRGGVVRPRDPFTAEDLAEWLDRMLGEQD